MKVYNTCKRSETHCESGELSKETGVSERSLRHYEEKGLLPSGSASQMAIVILTKVPSKKVELIQMYLQIGLNLEETARMLRCLEIEPHLYDNPCSSILTLYEDKLNEVTKQISLLSNIQTNLQKHVSLLKKAKEKE
ncbi:MerR family DNA-binding transcriptional regulator [Bacillus pacificus]